MLIDCYVKPGHYDFLFKTLSFKTRCLSGFFCFESIVLIEYYSPDGHFNWKFPQKKSSPLLPESVLGCSICHRISVPPMWSTGPVNACPALAACQHSCWALAFYLVSPSVTLGPGGGFSWLPSVLLSSIPELIENKSFQLKIYAFFSSGTFFFLLLFLYFSLSLFCSLLWSPVIIYKLCLSFLPLNYHQGAWGKCRIPGPSPDLLLENLLHPKTPGLCVHIKIRLKRISFALTLFGCLNQVELFRCWSNTKCSSLVFQRQIIKGPTSQAHFKSNQVNVCKVLLTVPYV